MKPTPKQKSELTPEVRKYMAELGKRSAKKRPRPSSFYRKIGKLGGRRSAKKSPKPRSFYQRIGKEGARAQHRKAPRTRAFYQRIGKLGTPARMKNKRISRRATDNQSRNNKKTAMQVQ